MKKDNYIIKSLNGMAYGFFCSLIIGTIFKQIGNFANISQLVAWGGNLFNGTSDWSRYCLCNRC